MLFTHYGIAYTDVETKAPSSFRANTLSTSAAVGPVSTTGQIQRKQMKHAMSLGTNNHYSIAEV